MDFLKNSEVEVIEDLQYKEFKIIQQRNGFKFGVDAVLCAYYSEHLIKPGDKVLDLGTGTGIISILLAARTDAAEITGVEIQKEIADMARRSVALNDIETRVSIVVEDIANISAFGSNLYDHVVSNPPYKKTGSGIVNPTDKKAISRHEVLCNLEDVVALASKVLKQYGTFTMVHRPERICDIMELLRKYKLEPKSMRMVYPSPDKAPSMVLIRSVKNAKPFLKAEPPLFIFNSAGNYTDEIDSIYNRD